MSDAFHDRVVLVTGGSRGFGRAVAAAFYSEGARVAIGARDPEQLKKAASVISARGARAGAPHGELMPLRLDVSVSLAVVSVVSRVVETWGRIDILIHAAPTAPEDCLRMTRACVPHVPGGARVLILSLASDPAARDAVKKLTLALAGELSARRITVNTICAGSTGAALEVRVVARMLEWASPAAGSITGRILDVGADAGS